MRLPRWAAGFPLICLPLRASAEAGTPPPQPQPYTFGDLVPIQCLNRSTDTGEHVQDKIGNLQYIPPFLFCNETSSPLSLRFNDESDFNCTIPSVSDETYHLLEFYIHHDSPLSCRIPTQPDAGGELDASGEAMREWVPLIFSLSGNMESSHLHVATRLNLLLHTSSNSQNIDSATAYSTSPLTNTIRLKIGDPLPLQFSVRWYDGSEIPRASLGRRAGAPAGHTLVYCLLSAAVGAGVCYAWVVGVDMPRRLKRMTLGVRGRDGGIINGVFNDKGRGLKGYGGYGFPGNGTSSGGGGYVHSGKRFD